MWAVFSDSLPAPQDAPIGARFARLVAADPSAAAREAHARFLLATGAYAAAGAAAQEAVDLDADLRPAWAKVRASAGQDAY